MRKWTKNMGKAGTIKVIKSTTPRRAGFTVRKSVGLLGQITKWRPDQQNVLDKDDWPVYAKIYDYWA